MDCGTVHWGEIPQSHKTNAEVIPTELRNLLILKAMKPDLLKLHQPYKEEETGVGLYEVPLECTSVDNVVLHTIQLLQHCKTMQNLISRVRQQIELNNEADFEELRTLPAAPPIPEQTEKNRCSDSFSTFTERQGTSPPRLTSAVAKNILRKSVATLLAHIGCDSTSFYVLDTLTDVAEDYIQKFTGLLRVAVDQQALTGPSGFPDVMERVFHEMGVGSVTTLHSFYRMRVLKYHQVVLAECNNLHDVYASLILPVLRPIMDAEIIRCGPAETDNEEDIPEIHFPALGDGYSADELQPSLEPGFQMLHSLEQEEQLQNLETEEEINVSDSPSDPSQQGKSRKKKKKLV